MDRWSNLIDARCGTPDEAEEADQEGKGKEDSESLLRSALDEIDAFAENLSNELPRARKLEQREILDDKLSKTEQREEKKSGQ